MKEAILAKETIKVTIGDDHSYNCTAVTMGRTGENAIAQLEITIPEALRHFWPYLDFKKPEGGAVRSPRLDVVNGVITYDIPSGVLDENGNLEVQLVLQNESGEIWKSATKKYVVLKSIDAEGSVSEKEDFFSEAQKTLDEVDSKLASVAPAIIEQASDAILHLPDVSALDHEVKVTLEGEEGVDVTDATLVTMGKNLFDVERLTDIAGATLADGVVYIPNTSSSLVENKVKIFAGGFVTLSFKRKNENGSGASGLRFGAIYKDGTRYDVIGYNASSDFEEFVWKSPKEVEYITTISGGNNPTWVKDIQLEFGTENTPFEPHVCVEYTPNDDGSVEAVGAISPVMVLRTETEGVIINAEYNADTKRYIDKRLTQIASAMVSA